MLVTGGGSGIGRACAIALARHEVELILCDHDALALAQVCDQLGSLGRFCDVASEASVAIFAAEFLRRFGSVDMIVNAAGVGHERMIGMNRISRALLPALKRGRSHNLLINVPPERCETRVLFRYAHSKQAFLRLSAAMASLTRGTAIEVFIACPEARAVWRVPHDVDVADKCFASERTPIDEQGVAEIASSIAALVAGGRPKRMRFAG